MHAPVLPVSPETLVLARDILARGGLVAIPTETVYGLACDAREAMAVARLYAAKGRPGFNPLIAHVSTFEMAAQEGVFHALARRAAEALWPGPLTLVLPVAPGATVCDLARAGLATVAVRLPAHMATRAIIDAFGRPLVAPSANRSGHVSPTRAAHVAADLADRIDLIVDDGPCLVGIESTIVSFIGPQPVLLRTGAYDTATIEDVLGQPLQRPSDDAAIAAPGQLRAHYAPRARLRLGVTEPDPSEGFLGFGPNMPGGLNLSPSGDFIEAASKLFAMLRALDERFATIAVAPIPDYGLGEAINDRLRRAAVRD